MKDQFNGDNAKLISAIEALLDLDAQGALVPHGVGGHARTMLEAAAVRLSSRQHTVTVKVDASEAIEALRKRVPGDFLGDPAKNPTMARKMGYNDAISDVLALKLSTKTVDNPVINVLCETTDGAVTGTQSLNVIRVEQQDDGSFTAVTDHWPDAAQPNPAVAAVQYAINAGYGDDGLEFLECWNEGNFEACRREWPDAPDDCYIGADLLFKAAREGESQ